MLHISGDPGGIFVAEKRGWQGVNEISCFEGRLLLASLGDQRGASLIVGIIKCAIGVLDDSNSYRI